MFSTIKTLLSSIIDYAGLFPPAKLSLQDAIANYRQYNQNPNNFLLGRFVIPAARLTKLLTFLNQESLEQKSKQSWSLSVIFSENWELELQEIKNFSSINQIKLAHSLAPDGGAGSLVKIASVEFKPLKPQEISSAISQVPDGIESFVEIPLDAEIETYLKLLKDKHVSAKIRTGGLTVTAFPSVEQLCEFIFASAKVQIPFKATAGLHHLLPGKYPLTDKPDSLWANMQGFLNLSVLAALVYWQKITKDRAISLLQETSLNNFQITEDHLAWKNYHLSCLEIEAARQYFFRSFGSCSFQEPLNDLLQAKLVTDVTHNEFF